MTLATRQLTWVDNNDGTFSATNAVALDADDETTHFSLPANTIAVGVQATGTFDSATATLQGSNDNVTFAVLSTTIAFTVAGLKGIVPADLGYKYYRVLNSGGGAGTALIMFLYARTNRP